MSIESGELGRPLLLLFEDDLPREALCLVLFAFPLLLDFLFDDFLLARELLLALLALELLSFDRPAPPPLLLELFFFEDEFFRLLLGGFFDAPSGGLALAFKLGAPLNARSMAPGLLDGQAEAAFAAHSLPPARSSSKRSGWVEYQLSCCDSLFRKKRKRRRKTRLCPKSTTLA